MARGRGTGRRASSTGATVGFEAELWRMAEALRGSMDAAEYKHVVLGLIFLKCISELKADSILADPPSNGSDCGGELLGDDRRFKHSVPPAGNASVAGRLYKVEVPGT